MLLNLWSQLNLFIMMPSSFLFGTPKVLLLISEHGLICHRLNLQFYIMLSINDVQKLAKSF